MPSESADEFGVLEQIPFWQNNVLKKIITKIFVTGLHYC